MTDQRQSQRIECYIPSEFLTNELLPIFTVKNFSDTGAFIETPHVFNIGQKFNLSISLSASDTARTISAEVVRADVKGYGITFKVLRPIRHYSS